MKIVIKGLKRRVSDSNYRYLGYLWYGKREHYYELHSSIPVGSTWFVYCVWLHVRHPELRCLTCLSVIFY